MSIKTKLLIFALSVSLIPIFIITASYYYNARSTIEYQTLNWLRAIAESKKDHTVSFLEAKKGRVYDFSSDGFIRDSLEMHSEGVTQSSVDSDLNKHLIVNKKSLDSHLESIAVLNINGSVIASTTEKWIGNDMSEKDIFKNCIGKNYGETFIGKSYSVPYLDANCIFISAPITSKHNHKTIGVIINAYNIATLNDITIKRAGMGESGEALLGVRSGGNVVFLTSLRYAPDMPLSKFVPMSSSGAEPMRLALKGLDGVIIAHDYRDIDVVAAYQHVPEMNWGLVTKIDRKEVFAPIVRIRIFTIILGSICAVVVFVIVLILSRKITNPIQKLVEGTKMITKGNLDFNIVSRSKDEIGFLANSFNRMTIQLGESKREIDDYAHNLKIKVEDKTKEINKSKKYSENLIETAQDAIVCIDEDKIINVWNKAAEIIFGYSKSEIIGKSVITILPEKYLNDSENEMKLYSDSGEGEIIGKTIEVSGKNKEGEEIPIDLSISSQRSVEGRNSFTMIMRDITERKRLKNKNASLEERLIRTQKLEAIGTMVGGIAHDFNNILTPIMGYTDIVMSKSSPSDPIFKELEQVLTSAYRAKDLVEQILTFSKHIKIERKPLDLCLIVKEALKLLRPSIPTTINIVQKINSPCGNVFADATRMHQVIVNLCTNAWQAMESNGGEIIIEVKQIEMGATTEISYPNLNQSEYVCLSVTDTGPGMDKAIIDHIFEPFFTTKDVDKGTGMGLSVTHGIVQCHDGEIMVDSKSGKGTSFHVYIPVYKSATENNQIVPEDIKGGHEPILLVDDDVATTTMLKQMLKSLGYRVDVYNNSQDALVAFNRRPEKYDLLISDLTMPDLTGVCLSEQVQKTRTGFPIIITTGYSDDSLSHDYKKQLGIRQVIMKPLKKRDLALAIREVFDV